MTDLNSMSLDEALAHYGKKGMKWGVTHKPTSSEIVDARLSVLAENRKVHKDIKTIKAKAEIARLRNPSDKRAINDAKKAAIGNVKLKALSNPDRLTANRMSNGDKAVLALLTVGTGGIGGLAAIAGRQTAIAISNRQIKNAMVRTAMAK